MIETKLNNLEINELTEEQFKSVKNSDSLNPIALYMTPSSESVITPISQGGTNAQTAGEARINLGFEYGEEVPTHIPETGDGAIYFKIDDEDDGVIPIEHGGTGAITGYDALRNLGAADYVIEQGTEGIWTWRKWNSGIAECWGYGIQTKTPYATFIGAHVYAGSFDIPSGIFKTVTEVNITTRVGSGWAIPCYINAGATFVAFETLSNNSSSESVAAHMNIKGTWK